MVEKLADANRDAFVRELRWLLNSYGMDAQCSIPDYVLAQLVMGLLDRQRAVMHEMYHQHMGGLNINELLKFNFGRPE
jgi:hypothetical protein